jgi:formylglycine-generating enzyme required for sulfatase activity
VTNGGAHTQHKGALDSRSRVLRGASWDLAYFYLAVAGRIKGTSGNAGDNMGFRVARTLDR